MNLLDGYLCVCLSAHFNQRNADIRKTIKRVQQKLPEHEAFVFSPLLKAKDTRKAVLKSLAEY